MLQVRKRSRSPPEGDPVESNAAVETNRHALPERCRGDDPGDATAVPTSSTSAVAVAERSALPQDHCAAFESSSSSNCCVTSGDEGPLRAQRGRDGDDGTSELASKHIVVASAATVAAVAAPAESDVRARLSPPRALVTPLSPRMLSSSSPSTTAVCPQQHEEAARVPHHHHGDHREARQAAPVTSRTTETIDSSSVPGANVPDVAERSPLLTASGATSDTDPSVTARPHPTPVTLSLPSLPPPRLHDVDGVVQVKRGAETTCLVASVLPALTGEQRDAFLEKLAVDIAMVLVGRLRVI